MPEVRQLGPCWRTTWSPTCRLCTSSPTSITSPTTSWPGWVWLWLGNAAGAMLKSPSTKIKCRSLPQIPASELRTRTQLDAGRGWRGRFCTCSGEKEEKYAPRQKVPRILVGMTCVGSSCRVEVHMVSSIGVPSVLGSFLTVDVSFHFFAVYHAC